MRTQGLTKMRMQSTSFCLRSTLVLFSSSAALEYMGKSLGKSGLEPLPKLGSPCNG
jgi:hypothetical protein